jgi:hypothetical protein
MELFVRRLLLAALPFALLIPAIACGGDDAEDQPEENGGETAAETTPEAGENEPTPIPDKPLPSPTPIPDDVPVVQLVAGGKQYAPMRSEFAALPKTKISAGGKDYEGVTLTTLAEKAGAPAGSTVTIQGTRADNLRFGAVRFPLSEIGAGTVFMLDEAGHVTFASSSVPPEQWLKDLTGIAFN